MAERSPAGKVVLDLDTTKGRTFADLTQAERAELLAPLLRSLRALEGFDFVKNWEQEVLTILGNHRSPRQIRRMVAHADALAAAVRSKGPRAAAATKRARSEALSETVAALRSENPRLTYEKAVERYLRDHDRGRQWNTLTREEQQLRIEATVRTERSARQRIKKNRNIG